MSRRPNAKRPLTPSEMDTYRRGVLAMLERAFDPTQCGTGWISLPGAPVAVVIIACEGAEQQANHLRSIDALMRPKAGPSELFQIPVDEDEQHGREPGKN